MKQNIHPVFPSILSTDYFNLESRLELFKTHQIDFIHLDIMDGHFVDNLSFGPSAAKAIKARFPFKIDSHLMVDNPRKMIPKFIQAGSDWVSFHMETVGDQEASELIALIKDQNCKAGLVLNPDSPVERVFPFLKEIDYVLLMSVFPGYGGQKFITGTVTRTAQLKQRIDQEQSSCIIQVDGGVNSSNIGALKKAGASLFVIGTFLFNSQDIPQTLEEIQNNLNE
jgi:ribulose-phosphate 3-epimerase